MQAKAAVPEGSNTDTRIVTQASKPRLSSPSGGTSGSLSSGSPVVALHRPSVALLAASLATLTRSQRNGWVASGTEADVPSSTNGAPAAHPTTLKMLLLCV